MKKLLALSIALLSLNLYGAEKATDKWVYAHLKVEMTYRADVPLPKYSVVYKDWYRQDVAMGKDLESALASVAKSMKLERLPIGGRYEMARGGGSIPRFLSDLGKEGWELTGTTTYSIKRNVNITTIFENFYFKRKR